MTRAIIRRILLDFTPSTIAFLEHAFTPFNINVLISAFDNQNLRSHVF